MGSSAAGALSYSFDPDSRRASAYIPALQLVDFFGAAGVHALLRAHRHATRLGRTLTLRGVHGITERVLIIVGRDDLIP